MREEASHGGPTLRRRVRVAGTGISRSERSSEPTQGTYREMERRRRQALFEAQVTPAELAG